MQFIGSWLSLSVAEVPTRVEIFEAPYEARIFSRDPKKEFFNRIGRVEMWRGSSRFSLSVIRLFRLAVPN